MKLWFDHYVCPGCEYAITDDMYNSARDDYRCPVCRKYKLSEFSFRKGKDECQRHATKR